MDCLFCQIAAGRIPANVVYEDDACVAFHDIAPAAPVHVLLIPKAHIAASLAEVSAADAEAAAGLLLAVPKIAGRLSLGAGFRVVSNAGEAAGQTVPHLHFHILGGRKLAGMG